MKKTKKHKSKSKVYKKMNTHYTSMHALAIVLMLVIFFDGMVFGAIGGQDLKAGLQILDVSSSVSSNVADISAMARPLINQAMSVHHFYVMASDEVMDLLDNNIVPNIGSLFQDIAQFYNIATGEMSDALDLSEELTPQTVYASGY